MDKYWYYRHSVQCPEDEVEFIENTFKEIRGKQPEVLCEDFCAAFAISCEWVKSKKNRTAIAVDLDTEPLEYGKANYLTELKKEAQDRLQIINSNVLNPELPKCQVIGAYNFSYFIFKKRQELKEYLESCYNRLSDDGLLIMDSFGGSDAQLANEEVTEFDGFKYYWDQEYFDPINYHAKFHIHYKPKGKKKVKSVFTYDWRLWTLPEVRELLEEVGFKRSHIYWEGTGDDGEGNGEFTRETKGEECEGWLAYIVAEK